MILPARLLWGIRLHEKKIENMLQVMHLDVCFDKSWYKNDRFHIEIMIYYSCTFAIRVSGHAPM